MDTLAAAVPSRESRSRTLASWALQVVAALILGQTLFFKFTGAPEAQAIFSKLGVEPWGRWATGGIELIAVVLLLWPRRAALGALLGAAVMVGAIGSHLTVLGIAHETGGESDGGMLFAMALVTLAACAGVAWLRRGELPVPGRR